MDLRKNNEENQEEWGGTGDKSTVNNLEGGRRQSFEEKRQRGVCWNKS